MCFLSVHTGPYPACQAGRFHLEGFGFKRMSTVIIIEEPDTQGMSGWRCSVPLSAPANPAREGTSANLRSSLKNPAQAFDEVGELSQVLSPPLPYLGAR